MKTNGVRLWTVILYGEAPGKTCNTSITTNGRPIGAAIPYGESVGSSYEVVALRMQIMGSRYATATPYICNTWALHENQRFRMQRELVRAITPNENQ